MAWIIALLVVLIGGVAWLVAQGRLGGMPPLVDDRPGPDLPDATLVGDDLRGVRFSVVARGYSMAQVDALLDRMANQLDGLPFEPVDELDQWARDGAPAPALDAPAIEDDTISTEPTAHTAPDGQVTLPWEKA